MTTVRRYFRIYSALLTICALTPGLLRADEIKSSAGIAPAVATPYSPGGTPMIEGVPAAVAAPGTSPVHVPHGKSGEATAKTEAPGQPGAKPEDAKTKEPAKLIHRPSAPATPPNPAELKVRPNERGKVRLNFNGQSWLPVLEWLATISGKSLDWQDLPGDYVNLTTQRSYTIPEVRDLINQMLLVRGFTLLCHGEVLTVAEVKKIDPSLVPRVEPADLSGRDPHEFVKVSFPLTSLVAESVGDELKPMLSPNGRLNALNETNRLEIMDAVANLRDIDAVLKHQSESNQPRSFREFKLKNARAAEVHRLLATLLGIELPKSPMAGEQQGGMNPEQAMMMARGQMVNQGNPPNAASLKPKAAVSMVVNPLNNSILVHAGPDKMAVIAQVVEAVDIPISHDDSLLVNLNRMQVYRLAGVDPEPVVKTLMEVGNLEPTTRLEIDKKNSAIIAYASLPDHVTIRAVVDKLSGSERKFEVIRLRRLAADYVAGTIDFMMGSGTKKEKTRSSPWFNPYDMSRREGAENPKEFRVDADVEYNRLLLWASPVELASVEALLVKLGETPAAGSGPAAVRVIDGGDAKETQELIEQIRHAWSSVAPNPLLTPATPIPLEKNKEPTRPLPAGPSDSPTTLSSPRLLPDPAAGQANVALFHLADMRNDSADSTARERSSEKGEPDNARPALPPVKITVGPDGKLIISSQDAQALDRLEELANQLASPRKDYRVFRLKYAWAVGVAGNLEDFFKEGKKERPRMPWWYYDDAGSQDDSQDDRRLSKRRKLTFISDSDSNTILVAGASAEQLKTIEDLIHLYDQPPPNDTQSIRKTELIHLKYSKANALAETVKDVFRDLLSANDKALASNNQGRDSGRSFVFNYSDTDKTEQKMPKFKGLLSIGVDETSNSLVVSAPAYLFDQVAKMIKALDQAAAPDYTVRAVRVARGMSAKQMKDLLDGVFRQRSSAKPLSELQPAANPSKPSKSAKPADRGSKDASSAGTEKSQ